MTAELYKMRHAIVIVLMFLVLTMSQAQNDEENILLAAQNFAGGVSNYSMPEKLARGVYTNFIQAAIGSMEKILADFILEYHQQAFRAKAAMIRDMDSACENLHDLSADNVVINENLIRVNVLLNKLLDCVPGNVRFKRMPLPDLPLNHGEIVTHIGNEKLSNIFFNLPELINRDIASVYFLMNDMYLAGWQRARLALYKLQDQFRNDYLNEILRSYARTIDEINRNAENIKNRVDNETWENYEKLCNRINPAAKSLEPLPS